MSKLFEYYGVRKKKGEFLFKEGEEAEHLYMIRSGRVQISKRIGKTDEEIQILGEGEFVGEMAVINSAPRSATAIALEDCELISMNKESFDNSVRDNHKFAISVIELLSDRLRETDELITDLISREREQELYAEVIIELLKNGKREKSGQWILIPFECRSVSILCGYGCSDCLWQYGSGDSLSSGLFRSAGRSVPALSAGQCSHCTCCHGTGSTAWLCHRFTGCCRSIEATQMASNDTGCGCTSGHICRCNDCCRDRVNPFYFL